VPRDPTGSPAARDRTVEEGPRLAHPLPLVALLDDVRSAFNVGSMFRTAEAARMAHLHLGGITPYPPNAKLDRTALGCAHRVSWSHHLDTRALIRELRAAGTTVWGVELAPSARSLYTMQAPSPLALVFGHETAGIDPGVLAECDAVVAVPMLGRKNSLNVATVFGVVVFEIVRQWGFGAMEPFRQRSQERQGSQESQERQERQESQESQESQEPRFQENESEEPNR
jgi:23S rRNA (guanosine2251-2'-O)-methyltransferase